MYSVYFIYHIKNLKENRYRDIVKSIIAKLGISNLS